VLVAGQHTYHMVLILSFVILQNLNTNHAEQDVHVQG